MQVVVGGGLNLPVETQEAACSVASSICSVVEQLALHTPVLPTVLGRAVVRVPARKAGPRLIHDVAQQTSVALAEAVQSIRIYLALGMMWTESAGTIRASID